MFWKGFLVNSKLSKLTVVKFWGDFQWLGVSAPNPCLPQGSTVFRKDLFCGKITVTHHIWRNTKETPKFTYRQSGPHSRSVHSIHVEVWPKQSNFIIYSSKCLQSFKQLKITGEINLRG